MKRSKKNEQNLPELANRKSDPLSAKIIRNVISSGVRSFLVAPVPFLLTPIILYKIGTAGYGTWAVFLAFSSLTSLADFGMVGTLSKHVAEFHARKDLLGLNTLLSTGLVIFVLLAVGFGFILWFGSSLLPAILFRGSPLRPAELGFLLRCYIIVIGANILSLLFASVTSGLQRLDLANWIGAANIYCAALVSLVLLFRGWGIRGLICGQVSGSLLALVLYISVIRSLLPDVALKVSHVELEEAKRMFGFSLRLYVTQAAGAIHNQLEKLLLALFTGVSAAGWYDIASDVALKIRGLIGLVLGPVLPAASELDALQDERRIEELYFRAQKYLAFVGVPIVCYVTATSTRFVELWIGPNLSFLGLPLSGLTWINFYNLVTGPGFFIFAGRGNLKPGLQSALVGIALNIILSLGLIYQFGFAGAIFGTAISLVFASSYFLYLFHRDTKYSISKLILDAYLKPVGISVPLAAALFLLVRRKSPAWYGLAILGIAFGVMYLTAMLFCRFFDRYDWSKLESLVPAMRHARRIIPVA
jgi:O-antigen/teichoic acid export membrane protein